jgi:hypothetical protein
MTSVRQLSGDLRTNTTPYSTAADKDVDIVPDIGSRRAASDEIGQVRRAANLFEHVLLSQVVRQGDKIDPPGRIEAERLLRSSEAMRHFHLVRSPLPQ